MCYNTLWLELHPHYAFNFAGCKMHKITNKSKDVTVNAVEAYGGNKGIAPFMLKLCISYRGCKYILIMPLLLQGAKYLKLQIKVKMSL